MPPRGETAYPRDPPWLNNGRIETQVSPGIRFRKEIFAENVKDPEKQFCEDGSTTTSIPENNLIENSINQLLEEIMNITTTTINLAKEIAAQSIIMNINDDQIPFENYHNGIFSCLLLQSSLSESAADTSGPRLSNQSKLEENFLEAESWNTTENLLKINEHRNLDVIHECEKCHENQTKQALILNEETPEVESKNFAELAFIDQSIEHLISVIEKLPEVKPGFPAGLKSKNQSTNIENNNLTLFHQVNLSQDLKKSTKTCLSSTTEDDFVVDLFLE